MQQWCQILDKHVLYSPKFSIAYVSSVNARSKKLDFDWRFNADLPNFSVLLDVVNDISL
jgi:hypothetical protein